MNILEKSWHTFSVKIDLGWAQLGGTDNEEGPFICVRERRQKGLRWRRQRHDCSLSRGGRVRTWSPHPRPAKSAAPGGPGSSEALGARVQRTEAILGPLMPSSQPPPLPLAFRTAKAEGCTVLRVYKTASHPSSPYTPLQETDLTPRVTDEGSDEPRESGCLALAPEPFLYTLCFSLKCSEHWTRLWTVGASVFCKGALPVTFAAGRLVLIDLGAGEAT